MAAGDLIAKARELPSGAVFHRCALQVNPHHYDSTYRGNAPSGTADDHARAVVQQASNLGVSVLAITDHNHVGSVATFRVAAEGRGIHIFPGFELSSSEGIHVLCIYDPDTSDDRLVRYLGAFGITDTNPSITLADKGFVDILSKVREQDGVAIAAHVTNDRGLLKVLTGQACIQAWRSRDLLAIQIPGPVADLPHGVRQIVRNANPDYLRDPPADDGLAIAVVNAKDIAKPEDLADRSATCWIKMSEVTIEGLRQAFLDPSSRIRLSTDEVDLEPEEHAELVALTWEGGFLDGAAIHFNPNLNVLVGGRGAGKSTVIESIRTVLGVEAIGDEAHRAHQGIIRHVLKNGTKISLLVRTHHPAVREYRIERTIPNPPLVRDDHGEMSNLSPRDVLRRVEVFGQHEISELTKSREKLTRLLDRFVEGDDELPRKKADLRRALEKNRKSVVDTRDELAQIEERLAALPGLEETLERFRAAGLEERLKEQSLLVREERLLASIPERLASFRECLEILKREVPMDRVFLSAKALEDLPGKAILQRLNDILKTLDFELQRITKELEQALARADEDTTLVRNEWETRKRAVQEAYEKILRELQKSRVDGEEFIRLRRRIEELRPLRERQASARRTAKEYAERRRSLLAEWEDIKAQEFRRLDGAAKEVNQKLLGRVQVEVTAAGNREPLFNLLREKIGGRLSEAIESLRTARDLSLTQFVEACRSGAEALNKSFGVTAAQGERFAKSEPEVLMRVEEIDLPPTTAIRLNTAPAGAPPAWHTLDDLSTGQKATAVLLLLLLESETPLIVDQPEDDLDNRFITEGVVPRMREEKQHRQFLFSTHNANIPVLGDAELIVGLYATGEAEHGRARIAREHMGSIDTKRVRELVEEILEGGKEAFERRRRKYGF